MRKERNKTRSEQFLLSSETGNTEDESRGKKSLTENKSIKSLSLVELVRRNLLRILRAEVQHIPYLPSFSGTVDHIMGTNRFIVGSLHPFCVPREKAQPSCKSSQALKQKLAQID